MRTQAGTACNRGHRATVRGGVLISGDMRYTYNKIDDLLEGISIESAKTIQLDDCTTVQIYINDIFMIWPQGSTALDEFVTYLNACHISIKFTAEISAKQINFLDITMTVSDNSKIITSHYTKPTDYLLYSSEHPRHLLHGIPYSQFLRACRICTNTIDFRQHALVLPSYFFRRGYPKHLVENALNGAELHDRTYLFNKQRESKTKDTKDSDQAFYLVVTHNPKKKPLRDIVHENLPLLSKSKTTRTIADTNLSDYLVKATTKTLSENRTNIERNPCQQLKRCRYCPVINNTGKITSHSINKIKISVNEFCWHA